MYDSLTFRIADKEREKKKKEWVRLRVLPP